VPMCALGTLQEATAERQGQLRALHVKAPAAWRLSGVPGRRQWLLAGLWQRARFAATPGRLRTDSTHAPMLSPLLHTCRLRLHATPPVPTAPPCHFSASVQRTL
jgi:hypothetical protein